ncbi:RNA polymerase recycling motor HelD [Lysinibacillus sp. Bpr_S20]|uniref:RNA polymerase recycling motor HelD n=1 Tax=Lysinibacillus sp. Bpr_S20 TaxID=2933964 RepID=UPI002012DCFE|nr:RNA polymerase recycling motor HelD [Lysinibacillus sp. Bpr_S20]MCL1699706.1 ATP-binding domain-containing protein [Lysinibacillus sp. Bpr_S20]
MTAQHPDFQAEVERLAYTKNYMQQILNESQRGLQSAQENIRKSMADLDYLDSSLGYINILANARFFEMARNQKEGLEAIQKKPYFARIHFQKTGDPEEFLYIGKTSLFHRETHEPIIVDWRSPVANVYYDGRLGDMEYDVRGEIHKGHLFAKRQYKINDGELLDLRDIDLTTNDELLQEALAGKADVRLTEIVSTIQKEQNDIIRAHLRQPIIVQGAAGSGKTTIALHRISYFLYTMGEHFNPEQLMILAPNKLFIDYIGDVLPELGVDKICQTTFTDYVLAATKLKLKLQNPNEQLESLVAGGPQQRNSWISEMKGSLYYRDVIERYVQKIEQEIANQFEDVFIEKYCIMRASHLKKLFLYEFSYMPIEKRLAHIKKVLASHARQKKQAILNTLHKKYDEALGKALDGIRDDAKRRRVVTKFIDERDERIPAIESAAKSTATVYMRRFSKHNIKTLYRTLLTNAELLAELAPEWHYLEQQQFLQAHFKEQWVLEDLAALYYLQARIKGIPDEWKMRVVFIDEVQDYSLFQLAALKTGLETDMFTMVGDLAQGIHSYRSLTAWEPVQNLFPRASFRTLQKSYRTTIEIMEVANKVLAQMDEQLPLVEPVVRHGNVPTYVQAQSFDAMQIKEIFEAIRANGHQSIALICKTTSEAISMQQALKDKKIDSQLLTENESINQELLLVVPSHLAKGLEFDAVIVAAFDTPFYDTKIDRKLLYVALTRAMHELYLIGPTKNTFLLE